MDAAALVQSYGYAAVAVGTFLEGETVLIAAGFAAHRGYLDLPAVIAIAATASSLGDQLFFWIGLRHGPALLRRFPSQAQRVQRVNQLLARYDLPLILSLRFLYGLRVAGPIALGIAGIAWQRFLVFNVIGAIGWAALIGGLGFAFGQVMEYLVEDIRKHEGVILLGIVVMGIAWWVWWATSERTRRAHSTDKGRRG